MRNLLFRYDQPGNRDFYRVGQRRAALHRHLSNLGAESGLPTDLDSVSIRKVSVDLPCAMDLLVQIVFETIELREGAEDELPPSLRPHQCCESMRRSKVPAAHGLFTET